MRAKGDLLAFIVEVVHHLVKDHATNLQEAATASILARTSSSCRASYTVEHQLDSCD